MDATQSAPILAGILRAAEWTVTLHSEHFKNQLNIPDHQWVPVAAAMGCAIISSDKSMQYFITEQGQVRPAIERSRAKVFFVRGNGLTLQDQAHAIGLARRNICRCYRRYEKTFLIARIHTKGSRIGEVQELVVGKRRRGERGAA